MLKIYNLYIYILYCVIFMSTFSNSIIPTIEIYRRILDKRDLSGFDLSDENLTCANLRYSFSIYGNQILNYL